LFIYTSTPENFVKSEPNPGLDLERSREVRYLTLQSKNDL